MYPHISARSFRTTELAKGFAKLGHDVTLYTILGKYDYSKIEAEYPTLHIKSLGKTRFGNPDSDGFLKKNIFQRIFITVFFCDCSYDIIFVLLLVHCNHIIDKLVHNMNRTAAYLQYNVIPIIFILVYHFIHSLSRTHRHFSHIRPICLPLITQRKRTI